jgi:hypothetical protein
VSDDFEKVKTRILKDAAGNGGPTTRDLVDLIAASHSDNAVEHTKIVASLDAHVIKLDEMEERSMDIASGFAAVLVTPQFTALMGERDLKVERTIAAHVTEWHKPDEEVMGLKRAWKQFKWVFVFIGVPVMIILADQLGNVIFGGAT